MDLRGRLKGSTGPPKLDPVLFLNHLTKSDVRTDDDVGADAVGLRVDENGFMSKS